MSPIRRRIAERLVEAQQTAALLTTFNEIDMSAVIALRNEHRQVFQEKYGIKLGFMSFFVKAVDRRPEARAAGQRRDPRQRHRLSQLLRHRHRRRRRQGAGRAGAARRRADELRRDRAGDRRPGRTGPATTSCTLDELQGGTFTITNGGVYGSLLSTPIVNPPQSGILGLHAIQDRPVARDGPGRDPADDVRRPDLRPPHRRRPEAP